MQKQLVTEIHDKFLKLTKELGEHDQTEFDHASTVYLIKKTELNLQ